MKAALKPLKATNQLRMRALLILIAMIDKRRVRNCGKMIAQANKTQ